MSIDVYYKVTDGNVPIAGVTISEPGTYTLSSPSNEYARVTFQPVVGIVRFVTMNESNNYTATVECAAGDKFWLHFDSAPVKYELIKTQRIPMGYFTVSKCSRQASTGIMKVTAYNKLQAKYLDEKANTDIESIAEAGVDGAPSEVNIGYILDALLGEYAIKRKEFVPSGTKSIYGSTPATSSSPTYQLCMILGGSYVAQGIYLHVITKEVRFLPGDYSVNNIYRLVMNCKKFVEEIQSYKNGVLSSYDSDVYYLRKETVTPNEYIKVSDFIRQGDFDDSTALAYLEAGTGSYYVNGQINPYDYPNDKEHKGDWTIQAKDYGFAITVPVFYAMGVKPYTWQQSELDTATDRINSLIMNNDSNWYYEESAQSELEKTRITLQAAMDLPDVTLRELQSAIFEQECQFGQLDRVTDLFEGVELNHSRLYPATSLYPANTLYPDGAALSSEKSMYSKLWADEGNVQKWRYLIITYKGLDENNNPKDFTMQKTINADGTQDYVMSDNWLFKNLVWTSTQINSFATSMVAKMQNITWFPFEMWCAGLPYLETGDEVEISVGQTTYVSYVLQRQLKGIQNLQDTYINGTLDIF